MIETTKILENVSMCVDNRVDNQTALEAVYVIENDNEVKFVIDNPERDTWGLIMEQKMDEVFDETALCVSKEDAAEIFKNFELDELHQMIKNSN